MGRENKYEAGETQEIMRSKTLTDFFEIPITVINEKGSKSILIH